MNEQNDKHWYAIYVKSRHEFKVNERLQRYNIETFLPTVQRMSRWKDRKKYIDFPIFPGYLFVHLLPYSEEKLTILKIPGVVSFVGTTNNEPEIVPDEQVMYLMKIVQDKGKIDPYPYLKEGQRIRIKRGALMGVEGLLVKKEDHYLLVISVDILRQGVCIKINADDVEKA